MVFVMFIFLKCLKCSDIFIITNVSIHVGGVCNLMMLTCPGLSDMIDVSFYVPIYIFGSMQLCRFSFNIQLFMCIHCYQNELNIYSFTFFFRARVSTPRMFSYKKQVITTSVQMFFRSQHTHLHINSLQTYIICTPVSTT